MILSFIASILFLVMIAYMARHFVFTYYALFGKSQQFAQSFRRIRGLYSPKVTVLIPAHNEESVLSNLLNRMTQLTYPRKQLEVLVVDDGSTDRTDEIADLYARKYRFIKAIHRRKGGTGKPAALHDGLKFSSGEIVLTFDADYYPQLDIIEKLVAPFVDPEVGAVQGRVTVLNEEDSLVSKIVTMERIGGYRVDQQARDELALIPQYGGTVGGFRRDLLQKVGGWDPEMLTEDTDLTLKFILQGYQIRYVNDAEAYEEAVSTWKAYWNQRYRWARGHMECAVRHLKSVFNAHHLSFYEKTELTLLLCVYFMPILVLLGWITGLAAYLAHNDLSFCLNDQLYFLVLSAFTYSAVGNFAPFFEVGSALYLDNRRRLLWMLPVLIFAFIIMAFCCTKALIDLILTGKMIPVKDRGLHHDGSSTGHSHSSNRRSRSNKVLPLWKCQF
jgi:cellulose synthase/poly-beta-1,6-N-acetylglucosamine synthase-like glycosyltransferase